jgi:hypothetical protein
MWREEWWLEFLVCMFRKGKAEKGARKLNNTIFVHDTSRAVARAMGLPKDTPREPATFRCPVCRRWHGFGRLRRAHYSRIRRVNGRVVVSVMLGCQGCFS